MDKFLKMVAADLYQHTKGDLSHTMVVFPNKRAKLYFDEYLAVEAKTPIWAPSCMSISELLCSMSAKEIGDPIKLICQLYRVYSDECGGEETLDDFYFWGEMLLGDFNDVDNAMVDAKDLFRNLEALKDMEDLSYLSEEQLDALRHFFGHFDKEENASPIKENFSRVWNKLLAIYHGYRANLAKEGIAYEGMLYREVVENLDAENLPYDRYVFVGFNVLTRVQHRLFSTLKKAGKALFYWDYDISYIDNINHEAGIYLSQNIKDFPSPLPREKFDAFSSPKKIQFVEASTETAQARFLHEWTRENLTAPERDTAIVLCNEALLSPVLHSLPTTVEKVNVTMGYPIVHTPVYSLLSAIMEAHTKGYNTTKGTYRLSRIRPLLKHPFVNRISPDESVSVYTALSKTNRIYPLPQELGEDEVLQHIFTPTADKVELCELLQWMLERVADSFRTLSEEEQSDPLIPICREAIFVAITVVNRFRLLIDDELADIKTTTFCSLLQRNLSMGRIPFHSEPAEGLQIMGVIETRNLDFSHVAILSCNEGFMPRVANDVSFIPYNLRKAFDMTTVEHKISLYAYYFYRLLQRAETISLVYNTVTDGRQKGEMSRFMLQLLIDTRHEIDRIHIETEQRPHDPSIKIEKTQEVIETLLKRFDINQDKALSPSALNAFMDCSLKFYLKYAANLTSQEEADEEVDNAMFGTLFHKVAEDIYSDLARKDKLITKERLEPFIRDTRRVMAYIDKAFREEYFQTDSSRKMDYNGLQLINREAIAKYVHSLLEMDMQLTPFEFAGAEQEKFHAFRFDTPSGPVQLRIGGTIDRMDRLKDGTLRIIDYKTGGSPKFFKDMNGIVTPHKDRPNYIFQIFLYSVIMRHLDRSGTILPQILYINRAKSKDYQPYIQQGTEANHVDIKDFTPEMVEEFQKALEDVVSRIFDPKEPFTQTTMEDKCKYCDFTALCNKVVE